MSGVHRVYLASAGTGKTWLLSGRFLDLLLAGEEPRRILATTFTRAAAGEILDRVLERLLEAAEDPEKRAELAAGRTFGGTFEAGEAVTLLARLTRELDRFQVRTLDSFFVHLGRLFALDLDLAPQWTIAVGPEESALEDEAIARLLGAVDQEAFAELLRGVQKEGGAERSVDGALKRVIEQGRAVFLESRREAWCTVEVPPHPSEEERREATAVLEAFEPPRNKNGSPDRRWREAHEQLLALCREELWSRLGENGIAKKVVAGEGLYCRKPIPEEYAGAVETLFRFAVHETLAKIAERNERMNDLLATYEKALAEVKRERGAYAFGDVPRALAPAEEGAPGPIEGRDLDLWFRLDGRLDHLLLDEFQDTAPCQWRILQPLAEELAASGTEERSFFCVGDVKQSIYGWRSAEPRLLERLPADLNVEPETLELSYRSSQVVLDALNLVFGGIGHNPVFGGEDRHAYRQAAERIEGRFDAHRAARDLPGAVELRQAREKAEGEQDGDPVTALAVERVVALARTWPHATIGVLLRSNKPIPGLIDRLQRKGLRASGLGGNPLIDSMAVLHLLSLLHLADHPSDRLAAFHLRASPLAEALGFPDPAADPAGLSRQVRQRLAVEGYGAFCARLQPAVDAHEPYGPWDRRRFRQLVDLAFARGDLAGLRTDRFVDLVREQKVDDPAASQIKVMTIHASKGLEFDAAVLPELDGQLLRGGVSLLTERPDPRKPATRVSLSPGKDVALRDPGMRSLYEGQVAREVEEALSVLYVGMSRARHRLELLVQHRGKDKDGGACYAGVLRHALGCDPPDEEGILWRHEGSTDEWMPAASEEGVPPAEPPPPFRLAATTAPRRLPRRTPSAAEGGTRRLGADILSAPSAPAMRRGSLHHRWMEEVEWLDETSELDEARLFELGRSIEPDEEHRQEALASFREALRRPAVRESLTRPAGDCQLWRERSFCLALSREGRAELVSGVFDRVVLHREGERIVSAEIIDFKTDAVTEQTLAARIEHYRPQLEGYREALAAMTGLAEAEIRASLLFLALGRSVEVGGS